MTFDTTVIIASKVLLDFISKAAIKPGHKAVVLTLLTLASSYSPLDICFI